MEFTTIIDGKEYKAEIKGRTYRVYREAFKSDLALDYDEKRTVVGPLLYRQAIRMAAIEDAEENGTELDYSTLPAEQSVGDIIIQGCTPEFLEHLAWACLKTATPSLRSFNTFLDNVENYRDFLTFGAECYDKLYSSMLPVEQPANTEEETAEEENEKKS